MSSETPVPLNATGRKIDSALIMAGGSGQRMRSSGVAVAKPLVPALGVALLERNVYALLRAGFRKITVVSPVSLPEIAVFVHDRLSLVTSSAGATIDSFVEKVPLGNIGCAGHWRAQTEGLLVVYADNLTTLDLHMVAAEHEASGADMTIATHKQPFRMPFGEVRVESGEVVAYVEKPTYYFDVCSAISVLGPAALAILPDDRPTGLSELVQNLIEGGRRVCSVAHTAPWTDVNDAVSLPVAEMLIASHQRLFDLWAADSVPARMLLCELSDERVHLLPPKNGRGSWTMPLGQGSPSEAAIAFDDLDEESLAIQRYFLEYRFPLHPPRESDPGWWPIPAALVEDTVSQPARRALALALKMRERS